MPAKSDGYWRGRSGRAGTSWYCNRWLDWYVGRAWHDAWRRLGVRPDKRFPCLDVGCGDGRWTQWLAETYGCPMYGVDLYDFAPPPHPLVEFRSGVDAEQLTAALEARALPTCYGLVVVSGVLECVSDWRRAFHEALKASDRVVFVEDLRERPAPYQMGLPHKTAITWDEFRKEVRASTHALVRWAPMTVIDRALAVRVPRWTWALVMPATVLVERGLVRLPAWRKRPEWSRFKMVYLRRVV